jgi:hypothetical protein
LSSREDRFRDWDSIFPTANFSESGTFPHQQKQLSYPLSTERSAAGSVFLLFFSVPSVYFVNSV